MQQGLIGQTLGRYRITEHLGRGGMAEVYKAYQPSLDRYVAIKVMHSFLADDKGFLERFQREAKTVAALRHANIVQVHDFDVSNGVYYLVMEHIDGVTLKTMMEEMQTRGESLSLQEVVRIIIAVGEALRYAHEYRDGMVHRDVKPANVMMALDGHAILTDFGIAKIMSATNLTVSGAMVGTPSYMSPEQGMGDAGDARSDIYSLGVMLYELAVGRLPYDADTPLAVVLKHINEPLPIPRVVKPDMPEPLERVILKALAKDRNDRYQSVADMIVDLQRALSEVRSVQPNAPGVTTVRDAVRMTSAAHGLGLQTPPPESMAETDARQRIGGSFAAGGVATQTAARPKWLLPVIGIVAFIVVGGGVALVAGVPASTPTPSATFTATPTIQTSPSPAAFVPPQGRFNRDNVDVRSNANASAQSLGVVGSSNAPFLVRGQSADGQWLRIELADGTLGWVPVDAVDLGGFDVSVLPMIVGLSTATASPTPEASATFTEIPTDTPTITLTPQPTSVQPTRVAPTRAPATLPPPPPPTLPAASPTSSAAQPLGWGFTHDFCTYDGSNYTCNVTVWGSGGDGKYHFALENPDTGNWDEKTGSQATYLVRNRRCRVRVQQVRIWDESGNHIEPNLTTDPAALASLFPGGACTEA